MTNAISIGEWLGFLDAEYLSTFIKDGGASVKFAVTPDEAKPALYGAFKSRADERDCVFVEFDSENLRAHMPQDIFFGIASQIDWRLLARRLILRLAEQRGFQVDGVEPRDCANVFQTIADANNLEARSILFEMRPVIQDNVLNNSDMTRDFRTAMFHLCLANDDSATSAGHPILDWLSGANTRIGNVRQFGINTAINRATARYFIESALYWVRHVGYAGTVMLLDNARVMLTRRPRPPDGKRYYTRAMAMEHYELLREFIDDVDRLSGTLLVVVTNYEFLDEQSARGYGIYQALRTRVMDDVRDRNLVNPAASLVRLE